MIAVMLALALLGLLLQRPVQRRGNRFLPRHAAAAGAGRDGRRRGRPRPPLPGQSPVVVRGHGPGGQQPGQLSRHALRGGPSRRGDSRAAGRMDRAVAAGAGALGLWRTAAEELVSPGAQSAAAAGGAAVSLFRRRVVARQRLAVGIEPSTGPRAGSVARAGPFDPRPPRAAPRPGRGARGRHPSPRPTPLGPRIFAIAGRPVGDFSRPWTTSPGRPPR